MLTIKADRRAGKTSALVALYRLDPENSYIITPNGYRALSLAEKHSLSHSHVVSANNAVRMFQGSREAKLLIDDADALDPAVLKELRFFNVIAESWTERSEPLEYDEPYYFIVSDGVVALGLWRGSEIDRKRYAFGNCFKTAEIANAASIRVKEALIAEQRKT